RGVCGRAAEVVVLGLAGPEGKRFGHARARARPVTGRWSEALRSFVLSCAQAAGPSNATRRRRSLLGEALGQGDQRTDRRALRPAWGVGAVFVGPVDAGDVEVRPVGTVLDRGPEERCGLDRATLTPRAVLDVGDLHLDLVLVFVGEWHR